MSSRIVFLLIIGAVVYGPNPAVADPHREETTPTGWWWHTNVTEAQIADIIEENDARLIACVSAVDAFIETRRMALVK